MHTFCAGLGEVPEGQWFCPTCSAAAAAAAAVAEPSAAALAVGSVEEDAWPELDLADFSDIEELDEVRAAAQLRRQAGRPCCMHAGLFRFRGCAAEASTRQTAPRDSSDTIAFSRSRLREPILTLRKLSGVVQGSHHLERRMARSFSRLGPADVGLGDFRRRILCWRQLDISSNCGAYLLLANHTVSCAFAAPRMQS